ncbi:MAG: spore coat protein CotJB [Eubacteriales bacterium]|nr:spore coat protein CotJB [Eubacteriales bacterium]
MSTTCECETKPTLAMATIPKQKWCEPYDLCTALSEGTIFPSLNLTFFKAPQGDTNLTCYYESASKDQQEREKALSKITEVSFALNDLTLYLDTHPTCESGLTLFHTLMEERLTLLADYAKNYYPLTQASMITGDCNPNHYGWGEGPAPWEGACI